MIGGVGALLAGVGGATWAIADRGGHERASDLGMVTTALGVATLLVGGVALAAAIGCRADADCAANEECREIPAPPGGEPYAQCMVRR